MFYRQSPLCYFLCAMKQMNVKLCNVIKAVGTFLKVYLGSRQTRSIEGGGGREIIKLRDCFGLN